MRRRSVYWIFGAFAAVALLAAGVLGWYPRPPAAKPPTHATTVAVHRVPSPSTGRVTAIPTVSMDRVLPGYGHDADAFARKLEKAAAGHDFRVVVKSKKRAIGAALKELNAATAKRLHLALERWEAKRRARTLAAGQSALAHRDWSRALRAYEKRVAMGDTHSPVVWWGLARSLAHQRGFADKAVGYAAYLSYRHAVKLTHPDVALLRPSLDLLRRSLAAQKQYGSEIRLLRAMQAAYPKDDASLLRRLKAAVAAYGLRIQRITQDVNVFPTRVCLHFVVPLSRSPDFHASTWVEMIPARPRVAVVRENGGICIRGLPAGTTTTLHIRAGLPAVAGVSLAEPLSVRLSLPDRAPRIIVDTDRFILPASLPPAVGFSSVNISKVDLQINRVPQRALLAFVRDHPLWDQYAAYPSTLDGQDSVRVWHGSAAVPHFVPNRLMHTILPLPPALAKPGLYAIQISPGDGTPNPYGSLDQVQLVLRTNLAPTVWRGRNGLTVQIRHFTNALPWPGVRVKLIAKDNDVLETARSNAQGLVHFAQPILQGSGGQRPAALHFYSPYGGFTLFDLHEPALNLSGRGISGRPSLRPVSPYLWLDRGIYRPGETVHVTALYRGATGRPLNLPLHLIVRRPGGQVFLDTVPHLHDDDSIAVPVHLPAAAQDGIWSVSLATGRHRPSLAKATFTVAAFVPPSLAVHLGVARPLAPGSIDYWPVTVRYLYGAPGAHLGGLARITLHSAPVPYSRWRKYLFGLSGEVVTAPAQTPTLRETDTAGRTTVPIDLRQLPDSTRFLRVHVQVFVDEPSGRAVDRGIWLPITPAHTLIGIAEGFRDKTVPSGRIPRFRIVAVGPHGRERAMPVEIQVVRQSPQWSVTFRNGVASWGYSYIDRPVLRRRVTLPAASPYRLHLPVLPYGRYRLRVTATGHSLAASSVIFYSGWQVSDRVGVPQRVSVRSNAKTYAAGSRARIHVSAPFAGPAVLVLANDRILSVRDFFLPPVGTTLTLRVRRRWGAGAYAVVDVFRPASATQAPERALGLTWLGLEPGNRTIRLRLAVPKVYRPRERITVPVHTRPGAYVTLAAVDQGILNLTQFPNPNPLRHFFGKRRLDVRVLDEYGALLARPEGYETLLDNGAGANFGPAVRPIPQKVVALFAGPVRADGRGIARLSLKLPEFDGELHLMAVTWKGDAVGAAHTNIRVRNRLVAKLLLPRFLAPGDEAQAAVMLQNLKLPTGLYRAVVRATAPVKIGKGGRDSLTLAPGAVHLLPVSLKGTGEGTAHLTLAVTGPQNYRLVRHWSLVVHSPQFPTTTVRRYLLGPGARRELRPDTAPFVPGSVHTSVTLGNTLPFNPKAYAQALYDGWHSPDLLTIVSEGMPLTVLRPPLVSPQWEAKLQHDVDTVLNFQRYDGAFGFWSSEGRGQPWLSAYATEFLLHARAAGATVPEAPVHQALRWLEREVENTNHGVADRIYAAYDLSLAGHPPTGAIRLLAQHLKNMSLPLPLAQLGASLAVIGERHDALRTLRRALDMHAPQGHQWWGQSDWAAEFGSPLRDAWAVPTVVAQTGLLPQLLPRLRQDLPGRGLQAEGLTTQDLSWALYAEGVLAGRPGKVDIEWGREHIQKTGPVVRPLQGRILVRNRGTRVLPVSIVITGIPRATPPAASHGLTIRRQFFDLAGTPMSPARLRQNRFVVVVLQGKITDGLPHRALVDMGLPPGWELAGSVSPGRVPHLSWLHHLSTPEATVATDDRYEAALDLAPKSVDAFEGRGTPTFKIAVLLRAVTPGTYTLPGVRVSDLFHPSVYAQTSGRTIRVTASHP